MLRYNRSLNEVGRPPRALPWAWCELGTLVEGFVPAEREPLLATLVHQLFDAPCVETAWRALRSGLPAASEWDLARALRRARRAEEALRAAPDRALACRLRQDTLVSLSRHYGHDLALLTRAVSLACEASGTGLQRLQAVFRLLEAELGQAGTPPDPVEHSAATRRGLVLGRLCAALTALGSRLVRGVAALTAPERERLDRAARLLEEARSQVAMAWRFAEGHSRPPGALAGGAP